VANTGARRARALVGRWAGTGFWAIADQGLFAVSNFGLNVLLARWLAPIDYGAFSVAYTIFLLLGTFHTAVLTEPMLVFGPGKYSGRLTAYLSVLLRGHWLFGAATGALFTVAGIGFLVLGDSPLTPALFGLAIASPFVLFQWLMRRACYVNLQPRLAAIAGAIYMVVVGAGALALNYQQWLGPATALGLMAVASLVSALWLVKKLAIRGRHEADHALVKDALETHWQYGRWAVGAAGLGWAAGNVPNLALPTRYGLEAVATLRAAFNFVMPVLQVFSALGSVMLPALVRARKAGTLRRTALAAWALYSVLALGYGLVLLPFVETLTAFAYGDNFQGLTPITMVLALLPLTAAATSVFGGALRALERPRAIFWAYLASAIVSISGGLALVLLFGAVGAAISMVLASIVTAAVALVLLRRSLAVRAAPDPATAGGV